MSAYSRLRRVAAASAFTLAGFGLYQQSSNASLVTLLNWAAVPDGGSPTFPVIDYTGTNLTTGIGAIGNGDGNLAPSLQLPGGLQVDTPFNVPIPYSFADSTFTGGTGYYDTTLTFSGLAAVGPASTSTVGPFVQDSQLLGNGSFTLTSTAPAGSVVLLTGNIAGASVVTGFQGGNAAAAFNADGVTYTGGLLVTGLSPAYILSDNDMSISMTGVSPAIGVNPLNGQLNAFNADATGLFDINVNDNVVPEPGMLSLLAFGVGSMAMRRARRRKS